MISPTMELYYRQATVIRIIKVFKVWDFFFTFYQFSQKIIIILSSVPLSSCRIYTADDFTNYGTLLSPELE
jgi:hypothetical protein